MYNLLKQFLILAIISLLVFFNVLLFKSAFFGWFILFFYLVNTSRGAFQLLVKFFVFPEKLWRMRALGMFISLAGLGLWSVPFALFTRFTSPVIALIFFLNGLTLLALDYWTKHAKHAPALELPEKDFYFEDGSGGPLGALLYLVLAGVGFYFLQRNMALGHIQTPWAVVDPLYLYIFALSTLILGLLIFTRLQGKTILFLLVVHSLLLHSYLQLSHQFIYGADGWRHMAVEMQILQEEKSSAAVYDTGSFLHALNPGQFSYAELRGLTVILSRLLDISLISLNAWLLPVLWSLIFPILLFEFAFALGWKKKEALFFVFLGFLPFALQAAGSFSLPVNFGFLFWLLGMLLVLKRIKERRPGQVMALLLFGLAMAGGYILYFILFWLAWGVAELVALKVGGKTRAALLISALIVSPLIIPAIELVTRYSSFNGNLNWLKQIRQFIGNFTGFYLASGPRPHNIPVGNILFNQTPLYAFVPNFLTEWRWWLMGVSTLIILLAIVGIGLMIFRIAEEKYHWFAILFFAIFGSYAISRYFLGGENILARRLDAILAFFILLAAFYSLRSLFERVAKGRNLILLVTIAVVTASIVASYSLGPDTNAVSVDDYDAASYIWKNDNKDEHSCVVGDTYPLLALEAVSAGKIAGGGFPMNEYFSQPERVEFLENLSQDADRVNWLLAMRVAKSDHCWLVVDKKDFKPNSFFDAEGKNVRGFGDILVWRYGR